MLTTLPAFKQNSRCGLADAADAGVGAHGPRRLPVVLIDDDPFGMAGPCDAPAA